MMLIWLSEEIFVIIIIYIHKFNNARYLGGMNRMIFPRPKGQGDFLEYDKFGNIVGGHGTDYRIGFPKANRVENLFSWF